MFQLEVDDEITLVLAEDRHAQAMTDRKSTRLNSSHANISYAVFCLKKKKNISQPPLLPKTATILPLTPNNLKPPVFLPVQEPVSMYYLHLVTTNLRVKCKHRIIYGK